MTTSLARQQLRLEPDRRRTEPRLRKLAQVFDNTEDGVVFVDRDLCIRAEQRLHAHHRLCRGGGPGEAGGRLLLPRRYARSFYVRLGEHLEKVGRWRGEVWGRSKEGAAVRNAVSVASTLVQGGFSDPPLLPSVQ